jgi:hypothetical protein
MHLQGFSGRAATTTLHDATATSVSLSGIVQAAEDFAVLCLYNAYDSFNYLRLKPLPRTDLSGLKLQFDIEYDHALDGAMRFDANKYASVAWDAVTFVCGAGDLYEVRLLEHAAATVGGETPATCRVEADGIWPSGGLDYLHLFFRDTRYTVTQVDARIETQLTAAVEGGTEAQWIRVESSEGFELGDRIYLERGGANEELTQVMDTLTGQIYCVVTINHPAGSYVTVETNAYHVVKKMAQIINTPGGSVAGRYGPDQSSVLSAAASRIGPQGSTAGALVLTFVTLALPNPRYGKLGNLDRILVTAGHTGAGVQGIDWTGDRRPRFSGGDDNTKYRITLDFTRPWISKSGAGSGWASTSASSTAPRKRVRSRLNRPARRWSTALWGYPSPRSKCEF